MRSGEQNPCPCCSGPLKAIGSRQRKYINGTGDTIVLVIRRLRCSHCGRLHHELPDILIPYKRYGNESVEAVVTGEGALTVTADESTIGRWRNWFFELVDYFLGCLKSIAIRYGKESVENASYVPKSTLQRIWHHVGDAPGWLARIVRSVANSNLWVHTRSAFLS
ncbi:MAG: DUF6431 domain-containing protein [Desulfotomaculaceae bacterium]|nr:DUF6431 domain-containing protein [Desulfotomaculaceae bacterium]